MSVEKILRSYIPAARYATVCFLELDEARSAYPKSPRMDGMPRGGGCGGLDEQVARIEALEKRAEKAREAALSLEETIYDMIDALDDFAQKSTIKLHYIYGYPWVKVGMMIHYSESHARWINANAIKALKEMKRWDT